MVTLMKRVIIGIGVVVLAALILLPVGSLVARAFAGRTAEGNFPAPGRLIQVDGRDSHVVCGGTGSPIILLEAGLDARGSWSWAGIQPELARISRVCSYDRAGILWSEAREGPRDAEHLTDELHALLAAASEAPPYVMVGHSFGGLLIRVYDQRFPGEAAGFVLVDASHPRQEERFPAEVRERMARISSRQPPLWLSVLGANYLAVLKGGDPPSAYMWRSIAEVRHEIDAWGATNAQANQAGFIGGRPLVVLTAGTFRTGIPGLSSAAESASRAAMHEMQNDLSKLSANSDHRVVDGASHYVHVDRPEVVVTAVRDVVAAVRGGMPVRREGK